MKAQIAIICCLLFALNILNSQTIINNHSYSFDDSTQDGWESVGITTNGEWSWSENGKADNSPYWEERDSIQSTSLGGAMIYNASKINGPDNPGVSSSGALESPFLNFVGETTVFLRFHQYYRNYGAITKIQYAQDGADWQDIMTPINENVNQNVETGIADYQVIDISTEVGDLQNMKIRFVFDGDYYFWILDDIEFYNGMPFQESIPEYVADSLRDFGYPYDTESSNWPHVPDELVVQFKLGTPETEKQAIRDTVGAIRIDSCACNRLELWRMGDNLIVDGDTLSASGGSIGIQERIKKSKATSSIDGVDYNRYNYNQMKDDVFTENIPHPFNILGADAASDTAKLIAILDTGIELEHDSLSMYIYRNNLEPEEGNDLDDDGNCLIDDWFGWNYVDKNNNPNDDHSHGTHVAGIIQKNMEAVDPSCAYRLIPYKTHDYHGVANLFAVACATYQAQEDGASVINDSWGFYGDPSIILGNAIDTAKINEVLIVSAAGNDTTDLSTLPQYPACYPSNNIITVGAYDVGPNGNIILADFSNFDPLCVDIVAAGVNVESAILNDTVGFKSGTSMAAPAVSAAAVMAYCAGHTSYLDVKNNVLDCADKLLPLNPKIKDGNVLNYNLLCITPVAEIENPNALNFTVYPNPVLNGFQVDNFKKIETAQLKIHSLTGQVIFQKTINNWMSNEQKQFDISKLNSGIYFLSIQEGQSTWTHKLIKI